ncbi:hypothetical protein [Nocardia puris]|uniref:Uncharacterized protein n=1 Tax=Nocardia puris TaxID=208602 RepID=A0A366DBX9_9NOCA|nr:hypothetical protein [Nocardia puris]RBO87560.1 hypothetical protein DFR74_111267 [Nocardia puris]
MTEHIDVDLADPGSRSAFTDRLRYSAIRIDIGLDPDHPDQVFTNVARSSGRPICLKVAGLALMEVAEEMIRRHDANGHCS